MGHSGWESEVWQWGRRDPIWRFQRPVASAAWSASAWRNAGTDRDGKRTRM